MSIVTSSDIKRLILKYDKESLEYGNSHEAYRVVKLSSQFFKALLIYNYEIIPLILKKIDEEHYKLIEKYDDLVSKNIILDGEYLRLMNNMKTKKDSFETIYIHCKTYRMA